MSMQKIIIIRFSLKIEKFQKRAKIFSEDDRNDWLKNRIEIFNKVTSLSLSQQDASVGIFMARGDEWAYEQLHTNKNFIPVFTNRTDIKGLSASFLKENFSPDPSYILRMDGDDAIHKDFFKDLKAPLNSYIIQPWGIKWDGSRTSTIKYPNNPFITTYTNTHMTPFFGHHTEIQRKKPIAIDKDPMWLHYIHGGNVSNVFNRNDVDWTPVDLTDFGL
jgi:hypothetical protein